MFGFWFCLFGFGFVVFLFVVSLVCFLLVFFFLGRQLNKKNPILEMDKETP